MAVYVCILILMGTTFHTADKNSFNVMFGEIRV